MSKVKVYELAKELGKDSKDVVKFLEGKNIEVKNHMSTISEDEAAMVKKALGGSKASASGDEAKAAPKKKNIVHVFRRLASRCRSSVLYLHRLCILRCLCSTGRTPGLTSAISGTVSGILRAEYMHDIFLLRCCLSLIP